MKRLFLSADQAAEILGGLERTNRMFWDGASIPHPTRERVTAKVLKRHGTFNMVESITQPKELTRVKMTVSYRLPVGKFWVAEPYAVLILSRGYYDTDYDILQVPFGQGGETVYRSGWPDFPDYPEERGFLWKPSATLPKGRHQLELDVLRVGSKWSDVVAYIA